MSAARPDDAAVRALYGQLLTAWNERDADAFAELFAQDGAMIGFDGSQANGGAQIRDHLRPIFEGHPTASYVAKVGQTMTVGAGSVLLRAMVGMVPPGEDDLKPEVNALQTLLAAEQEDGWRIVLFQNTPARYDGRPELVEQHTAELRPQLAKGQTLT